MVTIRKVLPQSRFDTKSYVNRDSLDTNKVLGAQDSDLLDDYDTYDAHDANKDQDAPDDAYIALDDNTDDAWWTRMNYSFISIRYTQLAKDIIQEKEGEKQTLKSAQQA